MIKTPAKCGLTVLVFLLLTVLDIIVVEGYYRPTGSWGSIWFWHYLYFILYVGTSMFMALKLRSFIPLSIIVAFVFGVEDTLFYVLQFTLPASYVGVEILGVWEPNLTTGLIFNLVGLAVIGLCTGVQLVPGLPCARLKGLNKRRNGSAKSIRRREQI